MPTDADGAGDTRRGSTAGIPAVLARSGINRFAFRDLANRVPCRHLLNTLTLGFLISPRPRRQIPGSRWRLATLSRSPRPVHVFSLPSDFRLAQRRERSVWALSQLRGCQGLRRVAASGGDDGFAPTQPRTAGDGSRTSTSNVSGGVAGFDATATRTDSFFGGSARTMRCFP